MPKDIQGQHLVRIVGSRVMADIDEYKEKHQVTDAQLGAALGWSVNNKSHNCSSISTLRRGKAHSLYGSRLAMLEKFFERPAGYYSNRITKTRNIKGTAPKAKARRRSTTIALARDMVNLASRSIAPDGMQLTLDYIQAVRQLPPVEQAKAQRLFKFVTEDLSA